MSKSQLKAKILLIFLSLIFYIPAANYVFAATNSSIFQKSQPPLKLSLNFQSINLTAVLQLLAQLDGTNMVVSDAVSGSITLHLHNIAAKDALELILRTRGLAKRHIGNVLVIGPSAEITAAEKAEADHNRQREKLAPLYHEFIELNYARALDIADLLKNKQNSMLSSRGSVSVDARTNTVWVQDTTQQVKRIRQFVLKLDRPVKQVMIAARIVLLNKDDEKDVGVSFSKATVSIGNNAENAATLTTGLSFAKIASDIALDVELAALESHGKGEIISTPRLITANQQPALIETGEEIPYQEATSSGATAVAFKKAVLSLKVTPQIMANSKIMLDLTVSQDSANTAILNGIPSILTREIKTKVEANNRETIVLGGIYQHDNSKAVQHVPYLGKIPLLGMLFNRNADKATHEELLIFITPTIMDG